MSDDLAVARAALEAHFGPVRVDWRNRWRRVAFGPCARCWWPAHTLGPNGSPFHAFCWGNPDEPSGFDQWVRRKDGTGEWGNSTSEPRPADDGERQWCATAGQWFEPTDERLDACAEHAEEMLRRWRA